MGIREERTAKGSCHSLKIENRSSVTLSGIEEVISYDEGSVVLQSSMGQLTIDGEGLNIIKLNLEEAEVCISGKLNALYYMEQRRSKGFLSGLFG